VGTYSWIVCGLVAFDVLLVTMVFVLVRSQVFPDRKRRVMIAIALSGFVFHAVLFFEGAVLYVQLATLALIYFALAVYPSKPRATRPLTQGESSPG
jgi:hypothetical protein